MKLHRILFLIFLQWLVVGCNANEKKVTDVNVIIHTDAGDIHVTLFATKTPVTAANFLNLARRGYYNDSSFHRVIPGFVSQTGKHMSGTASPGYTIDNETYTENPKIKELKHNKAGILSMARTRIPHSNGAQFYITHAATPHLDGKYTVFGEVTKGLEIATNLKRGNKVKSITIKGDAEPLFKAQKKNVDKWNAILDKRFFNLTPVKEAKKAAENKN